MLHAVLRVMENIKKIKKNINTIEIRIRKLIMLETRMKLVLIINIQITSTIESNYR